jgi:GTP pyrophosphokinase
VPELDDAIVFLQQCDAASHLTFTDPMRAHARGVQQILCGLGLDEPGQIAASLYCCLAHLPLTAAAKRDVYAQVKHRFGVEVTSLLQDACKLDELDQKMLLTAKISARQSELAQQQIEALRKMLLAFARDIRVVLIRLASILQIFRAAAQLRIPPTPRLIHQALDIYAPLANRLGIWQIKWELEDLAFRFDQPVVYHQIAQALDQKRVEREELIHRAVATLTTALQAEGLHAQVSGRAKHIYSIWKKMQAKSRGFDDLYDVRALRMIVDEVKDCYTALGLVHNLWLPIPKEFDDYIARPKPNGYRSLHTVVTDGQGQAFEVQIRTQDMHQFAEFGIAAHWRYKEQDKPEVSAPASYAKKIACLRQLLAWKEDASVLSEQQSTIWEQAKRTELDDHIYVLTPQAQIVALPQGATPIDFAYHLHTELGHRCRGARVDGTMVSLNTPLHNGQTVEVIAAKRGGPSRDWLNLNFGYLVSRLARTKVRAWFRALEGEQPALQLPKASSISPRPKASDHAPARSQAKGRGNVLVVGVSTLLTQLAQCCRPVPPDPIVGFITRGKGVSIHRTACASLAQLRRRGRERIIETSWGAQASNYCVDVRVQTEDKHDLLRHCTDIFLRRKIRIITLRRLLKGGVVWLEFTLEISKVADLQPSLREISALEGVLSAQRK